MEKRATTAPVGRSFITEMCEFSADFTLTHKSLYEAYKKWCKDNNFFPTITSKTFAINLVKQSYIMKKRYTGGVVWVGIRLKNGPEDELKEITDKKRIKKMQQQSEIII